MSIPLLMVNGTIKRLTHLLCRIDASQLARVPQKGPLIIVFNHINFLDAPVLFTHLTPRPVTGFAKVETWDNPLIGALFSLNKSIPIRRGQADVGAMRAALAALAGGQIIAVAPEGTRSGDGHLQRGYPGVVTLAVHSRAPLLPVAFYGNELFKNNLRRLKRTDFVISVGQQFTINMEDNFVTREVRQQITDEIMYQLARLMPAEYRGAYADLSQAKDEYLVFD
jgi:1-acyl-sn-glycerol-3-phosphate acyltransferase